MTGSQAPLALSTYPTGHSVHGSILQVQDNRLTRRQAGRPAGRQTARGLRADHGTAGGGGLLVNWPPWLKRRAAMLVPQNKEALLHLSQVNQWICDLKWYTIFKKQTKNKQKAHRHSRALWLQEGCPIFPSLPSHRPPVTSLCCFETGELTISLVKRHLMEMCGHSGLWNHQLRCT